MTLKAKLRDPRRLRSKRIVALVLTFAAGFVDIVGLLSVYKLFTAHMTGTTVHLGEQIIVGNWTAAGLAGAVVALFLIGSIVGRVIIELGARAKMRRVASITLALEAILLISVLFWGTRSLHRHVSSEPLITYSLLGMLAGAMGIQTATLTKVGPLTIHTTFVTGMLNKLAELVASWIFLNHDFHHSSPGQSQAHLGDKRSIALREAVFITAIWTSYLGGAICGTWLGFRWQLKALILPCLALMLAIAVDQFRPLSLEEEQEQLPASADKPYSL